MKFLNFLYVYCQLFTLLINCHLFDILIFSEKLENGPEAALVIRYIMVQNIVSTDIPRHFGNAEGKNKHEHWEDLRTKPIKEGW